jgi:hypothetical protein
VVHKFALFNNAKILFFILFGSIELFHYKAGFELKDGRDEDRVRIA